MDSFVDRFSTTSSSAEIRRAREILAEDGEDVEVMWGSQAGFGNLASGVPTFSVPQVPNVSIPLLSRLIEDRILIMWIACSVSATSYRRSCRPFLQNQDQARYNYIGLPIQRWCYCRGRFTSYSWKLCWSVVYPAFRVRRFLMGEIASGTVKKVIEINPYLLGTMAGGAGTFVSISQTSRRI